MLASCHDQRMVWIPYDQKTYTACARHDVYGYQKAGENGGMGDLAVKKLIRSHREASHWGHRRELSKSYIS